MFGSWTGLGDVCKYLLQGNIAMSCMFCGMNKDTWASLPEDLQTLIKDAFTAKVNDFYMPKMEEEYNNALGILTGQGVEVTPMSEELEAAMREATASFRDDYAATLGDNAEAILAIIDEAVANN